MHTHSQRLETWLGKDCVENMSRSMLNWYGPPIALQGVPGAVYACAGGDFIGRIEAGSDVSAIERAENLLRKSERARRVLRAMLRRQAGMAGFSSFSDLIAEATAGKRRDLAFQKTGVTGVLNVTSSLFGLGTMPAAGVASAAAPGGTVLDSTTLGGFPQIDDVSPDTRHFVFGAVTASVSSNNLLLYDRLFGVAKTMNSIATEAVTGVPTRYQSTTVSDADYIGGNFLFVEVGATQLAATAHNWTVCTYTDQDGAGSTLPSLTGNSAAIVRRLDHPVGQWFAPLASGDVGIQTLTQMQCSATVATGLIDFVIGHPIAFMPNQLANIVCFTDGINTAFNLVRVFDDACLAFLEVTKSASTLTTYSGTFTLAHG